IRRRRRDGLARRPFLRRTHQRLCRETCLRTGSMDLGTLKSLNEARRARQAVVLVTDLDTGGVRLVHEVETPDAELGEAIGKALRSGQSGVVETDDRRLFPNAHLPQPRLVVSGAVHISQALAPMARVAGYPLEIIDPR